MYDLIFNEIEEKTRCITGCLLTILGHESKLYSKDSNEPERIEAVKSAFYALQTMKSEIRKTRKTLTYLERFWEEP